MVVEPSGVILVGQCDVQTDRCIAQAPTPITAVWTTPGRRQVNVCRPCLDEMVRAGQWQIQGARLRAQYDVAALDQRGDVVLVVEVKLRQMGDADVRRWAVEVRRNLLAHSAYGRTRYFMLVLAPRWMFLWRELGVADVEAEPDYQEDIEAVLAAQLRRQEGADQPAWQLTEAAVGAWIQELLTAGTNDLWFHQSGLAAALAGGRLVREYAA